MNGYSIVINNFLSQIVTTGEVTMHKETLGPHGTPKNSLGYYPILNTPM